MPVDPSPPFSLPVSLSPYLSLSLSFSLPPPPPFPFQIGHTPSADGAPRISTAAGRSRPPSLTSKLPPTATTTTLPSFLSYYLISFSFYSPSSLSYIRTSPSLPKALLTQTISLPVFL
jgi:hypothetical protein